MDKAQKKIRQAFGTWKSPITPELIGSAIRLSDVQWDSDGRTLVWLEGRSGKGVLVAQPLGEAPYDLSGEVNVRGGVGYGGGEFTVQNGLVIFTGSDGRLYRRNLGKGFPRPITPAFGGVASPVISPDDQNVVFVHTYEGRDVLAIVDVEGHTWPNKLAFGADFYMQPTWHPSGKRLAWVEWDHPNMPWDGTRLMMAELEENELTVLELAGGAETPILQPAFSPDGRYLSYLQNEGEWDQLVLRDLETGEVKNIVNEGSLLTPAWVQGVAVQSWTADSRRIVFLQSDTGVNELKQADIFTGQIEKLALTGYTSLDQPRVSAEGRIALLASSPQASTRVISLSDGAITIHQRSTDESIPEVDLPEPYEIQWTSSDGTMVFGIYSPPANGRYEGIGLPPAVIYIHGGPTSTVGIGYHLDAAFFTSRGIGYLDVNYRGSTGFGRAYRDALKGNWGYYDVLDAAEGAKALVDLGLADPDKLVIKGGSAGGYTVLNALIHHPGLFKAGICSYGVSNLFTLAMDTHKFEERYTDSLCGPLPEAAEKYHEWSPVFHASKIKDAVIVFQGEEDKVVPPSQSEEIVNALRANGVTYEYHLYPGEGHGFRKSETLKAFYKAIERFLLQNVIYG
ncbi:MAG: S9 family peptidase [Anaerolineaceae bacterium]|nr:S9 family peptidase [Anaerolineaceae bacterium]